MSEREGLLRSLDRARQAMRSLHTRLGWLRSTRHEGTEEYQRVLNLWKAVLYFLSDTSAEIEREAKKEPTPPPPPPAPSP